MTLCPICSAEIPDDFGLIECGSCNAQLIVHMDGRVEHCSEEASSVSDLPSRPRDESEPEQPLHDQQMEELEPGQFLETYSSSEPILGSPEEVQDEFVDEEFESEELIQEDQFFSEDLEQPIEHDRGSESGSVSVNLNDIQDFGNSDISSSHDGSLRYNLIVSGIDTADVRALFREAITDRKMMWDADAILRKIKNGELTLEGLSAVKAFMLIIRLKELPVQMKWEQYAISQS